MARAISALLPLALFWSGLVSGCAPERAEIPGEPCGAAACAGGASSGGSGGGNGVTIAQSPVDSDLWVALYYPGWTQSSLPPEALDWGAFTEIIHFAWIPVVSASGVSFDEATNGITAARTAALMNVARTAGARITIAIGGAGNGSEQFGAAIADEHRAQFIELMVTEAAARGYDGIDIDMESFSVDTAQFQQFSRELRAYIDANAPHLSLTAAVLGSSAEVYGAVADVYDQINIMSYDLVWGVPQTWHNSALYGGEGPYYSVDRSTREYVNAGARAGQLGAGIKFGGYSYEGTSELLSSTSSRPQGMPYTEIEQQYLSDESYRWDAEAQVPMLSIQGATPRFITFDDAQSIRAKVDYVRENGFGGLILWDAQDTYYPGRPADERLPLLQAVKETAFGG